MDEIKRIRGVYVRSTDKAGCPVHTIERSPRLGYTLYERTKERPPTLPYHTPYTLK